MNKNITVIMLKLCRGGYMEGLWSCRRALKNNKTTVLITPNAEMLSKASKEPRLAELLKSGDILFPDGIGVYIGMKRLGLDAAEKSCGIELCQRLFELLNQRKRPTKVFLLGGNEGVAKKAAERLSEKFDQIDICGTEHGYFNTSGEENRRIIENINESRAEILLVCMGFPRQERWMLQNRKKLSHVRLMMGLGGSLDVWSGNIPRAPEKVRSMGLEWAYRAWKDPSRLSRLPALASFAVDVAASKRLKM